MRLPGALIAMVGSMLVVGCTGSSTPTAPKNALTLQVASKCGVDAAELTFTGDPGGFAGANYTWELNDGSTLVIIKRAANPYRLICPDRRTFILPSFDPSMLPAS